MPIIVDPVASSTVQGPGRPGRTTQEHASLLLGGITLGAVDEFGVDWSWNADSEGWDDPPDSTGGTEQRASDHGGWIDPAHLTPRFIDLRGSLVASHEIAARAAIARLWAAVPLSRPETMYGTQGAVTLQADVRQAGKPMAKFDGMGHADFSVPLVAPDPRKYSTGIVAEQTRLPATSGGLTLPLSLPLSLGATVDSGVLTVANEGTFETRPTLIVHGPCPPFTLTHRGPDGIARALRYPQALNEGRYVLIDTNRGTALEDGTASRRMTGTWFVYPPGTSTLAFSAATYNPDALLVSEHRHAHR